MAVTIRIKRGLKADLPILKEGEFGYCTDTKELFIGVAGQVNEKVNVNSLDDIPDGETRKLADFLTKLEAEGEYADKESFNALEEQYQTVLQQLNELYTNAQVDNLVASKVDKNADITAGTFPKITYDKKGLVTGGSALVEADIPDLDAAKITAGTFVAARIPNLNASKINAGTFADARIPSLAISKITNLQTTLNGKLEASVFNAYQTTVQDFLNGKLDKKPDGVNDLITALNKIDARYLDIDSELFIVTAQRPTTGVANKIYLVPRTDGEGENLYDEFIYQNNKWEQFGTVSVDLSNYYNKSEINSLLTPKITKAQGDTYYVPLARTINGKALSANIALDAADVGARADTWKPTWSEVSGKPSWIGASKPTYTKAEVGLGNVDNTSDLNKPISAATQTALNDKVDKVAGKGLSTNDFTNNDKNKLDGIETGAEVNVQSDWNITDTANDAFIKNKPAIKTVATTGDYADLTGKPDLDLKLDKNFSALPAQTNPLMTDVLVLNRGTTVQKVTLGSLLSQVDTEIFVVVSELPATGKANKIYLVPHTVAAGGKQNEYEEYTWVNNKWENIGKFNIDLSNYYNKIQIDGMLGSYVLKEVGKGLSANDYTNTDKQSVEKIPTIEQDILDLESDKVDKVSGMGLSSNDFTTTEKNKLSGIQAGAQVNAVTTVAGRTGAVVLAKADVGLGSVQNYAIASKAQAESGTSNDLYMTPLRTKELITVVMGDIESALDAILGV